MSNLTIQNNDLGSVPLANDVYKNDTLAFAAAGTVLNGTILARETATGKLVPFVKGGAGGAEIPLAILTYEVVSAIIGDVAIRALISGEVVKNRLVIAADGDDSNIDVVVLDQLRDYSIVASNVTELNILDNQ